MPTALRGHASRDHRPTHAHAKPWAWQPNLVFSPKDWDNIAQGKRRPGKAGDWIGSLKDCDTDTLSQPLRLDVNTVSPRFINHRFPTNREKVQHRGNQSEHRDRLDRGGGPNAVPQLRDVRGHRPRAAGRARRPQAGAAPHPVRDVPRPAPHLRPEGGQVCPDRRRRDGQLPPARRRRRSTRRWSAWRRTGSCACRSSTAQGNFGSVDGDPPAAYRYTEAKLTARRRVAARANCGQETVDMRANYDRHATRAGRPAGAVPEPARQRHAGHRRRHGDEHPAAQPRRSPAARASMLIDNPDATAAQLLDKRQGPGLPARRQDRHRPGDAAQRSTRKARGSIKVQGEWKVEKLDKGKNADRRHVDPLRRRQGQARRRPSAAIIEDAEAAATRRADERVEREGRPADRPGDQARAPTRTW